MRQQRRTFLLGMAAAGGAAITGCATTTPKAPTLRGYNVPAIDLHAHWHAPDFVALIEKEGGANGGKVSRDAKGQVVLDVEHHLFEEILDQHKIETGATLEKILVTHGHIDHIGAVAELARPTP